MLYGIIGVPFVYNFALRKFDFRGRWSATPKNRGRSKKTQGWIGLKSGGGSLAVGTYLQRGSAPSPPPPGGRTHQCITHMTVMYNPHGSQPPIHCPAPHSLPRGTIDYCCYYPVGDYFTICHLEVKLKYEMRISHCFLIRGFLFLNRSTAVRTAIAFTLCDIALPGTYIIHTP